MKSEPSLPAPARAQSLLGGGQAQEAFELARALADAGDPEGDFILGWMYHNGVALQQSDQKAEDHYLIAANRGSALGMFYLGWFYATRGDLERAVHWITSSSRNGCSAATYHLGRMHLQGDGLEESPEAALQCFEAAANQGHLFARMYIAREMLLGRRGLARIPAGFFRMVRVALAFAKTGSRDPNSELLLSVGGPRVHLADRKR